VTGASARAPLPTVVVGVPRRAAVRRWARVAPPRCATAALTRVSLPKRLVRFLQEVVAELRKVIWPSRKQLVTYTLVVLVFVSFMVALVALLDFLVGQGVNALFGA
jgi:preprotein translocase subunit SecE